MLTLAAPAVPTTTVTTTTNLPTNTLHTTPTPTTSILPALVGNHSLDFPLGDQPLPPLQEGEPLLPSFWKSSTHRTLYINNRFGRYLEMWPGRQIRGTSGRSPFCILVVLSHLSHVVMKGFISDQYLCMHPSTFHLYTRAQVHPHCYIQEAIRSGNIVYTFTRCRTPQNEACHLGMYPNGTMRPATDVRLSQTTAHWLAVDVSAEAVKHAVHIKDHIKQRGGWMTPTLAGGSSPVTAGNVPHHTSSQSLHPPTPKTPAPAEHHFVPATTSRVVRPTAQPPNHPPATRPESSQLDTTGHARHQLSPHSVQPTEHLTPSGQISLPKEGHISKERQTPSQTVLHPKKHRTSPQTLHPKEQRRKRVRRWCRNLDVMVRRPDKFLRRCKHDCHILRRMLHQPRHYQRRCLTALVRRRVRNKARQGDDSVAHQQSGVFNVTSIRTRTRRLWPERKSIFQRMRQLKRCRKKRKKQKNGRRKRKRGSCVKDVRRRLRKRAKRRRQKSRGQDAADSVSPSMLDMASSSSVVVPERKIRHRHRSRGAHRHRTRERDREHVTGDT